MSTSILLPPARVDIYGLHKETIDCANSLIRDWRFSRVALRVENKGIEKAIEDYEQHVSPDIVIIEVDDIGESFLRELEKLAEYCVEGTEAIIIAPKNDVHLYRQLMAMGIKDYLVAPVEEKELSEVIAKTLLDKKGLSESHIIAIMGSKGGVGASTISHILGSTLADKVGHKTLLLDGSGGWGMLTIPFGSETTTTLRNAIEQVTKGSDDDIKRLLYDDTEKLTLLPTGGDGLLESSYNADEFENMLDHFIKTYPVIVIDLSAAEHNIQKRILKKAHDIIIVSTPILPALRTCRNLLKEITNDRRNDEKEPVLLINMEGVCKSNEVSKKEIETILEYKVSLSVPYDTKLFMGAEAKEQEISRNKAADKILKPITDLAYELVPQIKTPRKDVHKEKQGIMSKLFKK